MVVWEESLHPQAKIFSVSFSISGIDFEYFVCQSLISNIAFGFGCSYFSQYEETGIGAHWSNIWVILALHCPSLSLSHVLFQESPMSDDRFSLAGCMGMMLIDSVLYGVLMWYIEAVFPGQYGVPKPFYFFLTSSYWTGKPSSPLPHQQEDSLAEIALGEREARNIEREPSHLPLGKLTSLSPSFLYT